MISILDRWFVGGILGGGALTLAFPGLPELAATQVLTVINMAIGLGGFGAQIGLSSLVPASVELSLATVGAAVIPAVLGIASTVAIIVGVARRKGGMS